MISVMSTARTFIWTSAFLPKIRNCFGNWAKNWWMLTLRYLSQSQPSALLHARHLRAPERRSRAGSRPPSPRIHDADPPLCVGWSLDFALGGLSLLAQQVIFGPLAVTAIVLAILDKRLCLGAVFVALPSANLLLGTFIEAHCRTIHRLDSFALHS